MRVTAHDPMAVESARAVLPAGIKLTQSLSAALSDAHVVIVTTPDPAYAALTSESFHANGQPVTVIDFWRQLAKQLSGAKNVRYVAMGRSLDDESNAERLMELWSETALA
jgi:hypothetical protein